MKELTIPTSNFESRDYRLDILKATSIIFILFWHLKPLEISLIKETERNILCKFSTYLLYEFFYKQITLVAVPTFIVVSLFLFYGKLSQKKEYFKSRMNRLIELFVFWTIIQAAFYLILKILIHFEKLYLTLPNLSFIGFIVNGGPSLPIVGGSVFYFIFVLIWLTILLFIYNKLNDKIKNPLGFVIIIFFLIYFQTTSFLNEKIPYWRLDNFIIYIPIVYLLKNSERVLNFKYIYLLCFLLFSIQDILLRTKFQYNLAAYGRASIFFGALTFLSFIMSYDFNKMKQYILFLSKYSLGIFAIHKYWQLFFNIFYKNLFSLFGIQETINFLNMRIGMLSVIVGIMTIASTIISAYLLSLTFLKRYIL